VGVGEIKRRRLYEIKPYVTGGWREGVPQIGSRGFDTGIRGEVGLEVAKIGITPSLTSEFTENPDFGQAEVDNQSSTFHGFQLSFLRSATSFWKTQAFFFSVEPKPTNCFSHGGSDSQNSERRSRSTMVQKSQAKSEDTMLAFAGPNTKPRRFGQSISCSARTVHCCSSEARYL
jgi:hypothetical protein